MGADEHPVNLHHLDGRDLRGPFENLIGDINALIGKAAEGVKAIGEVRLPDLMTRPDFAITRQGLVGFIELKAPGKGSDPTAFPAKSADRLQWDKLKALPNVIYTDGNGFTLWRDGKRVASATMQGDIRTAGKGLKAGPELLDLFATFYDWNPIAPEKPRQLAETAARLCRLLREQVVEQLARNEPRLTSLQADWGKLDPPPLKWSSPMYGFRAWRMDQWRDDQSPRRL